MTGPVRVRYLDSTVPIPVHLTEADVEPLARLAGVPIDPAETSAVAVALGVLLGAARLVAEFPLPEDVEAAPVFQP